MNPEYRTKIDDYYDEAIKKEKNTIKIRDTKSTDKTYPSINFVWLDGHEHAFNYSYMVSVSLDLEDNQNVVTANFTSHHVYIKGYNLHPVYEGIINHTISTVYQHDSRYGALESSTEPLVNEIMVA